MAKTSEEEVGSSAPRDGMKPLPPGKEKHRDENNFGNDPWAREFGDFDAAVNSKAFTPTESAERTTQPTLRSQLVSQISSEREENTDLATSPLPAKPDVTPEDEDDIAIPTPIGEVVECRLVPEDRDGRVEYIWRPIHGYEHLVKSSAVARGPPSTITTSCGTSDTLRSARQPAAEHTREPGAAKSVNHRSHTTGATDLNTTKFTRPNPTLAANRSQRSRHVRQPNSPPKLKTELQHVIKNIPALKRTRSIAKGLLSSRCARETSYIDADDEYEERIVKTEESKTFNLGDIVQLKIFFRNRIDELTMKPVRSLVTAWVKQLEPKRKGLHGPYHKKLPSEAAPELSPPWWPKTVPYSEPAHLDKDGLLTLAVDILLQHRDIPVDAHKRRMAWTRKLRRIAELEVEMTLAEAYTSSRSPEFSTAMKKRAEEEILPSLFDVSQSYEDHVNQYELWNYKDITKAPKGKSITWQFIPKPPKSHGGRSKRQRPAERKSSQPRQPVMMMFSGSSEYETDHDEKIAKAAAHFLNLKKEKEERMAARVAQGRLGAEAKQRAAEQHAACGRVSRKRNNNRAPSPTRTIESSPSPSLAPSPAPVKKKAKLATPPPQPEAEETEVEPEISSSFDGSINRLCLQEDTNMVDTAMPSTLGKRKRRNTPVPVQRVQNSFHPIRDTIALSPGENMDAKGGSLMESGQQAQVPAPHVNRRRNSWAGGQVASDDALVHDNSMRYNADIQLADDENDAKGGSLFSSGDASHYQYNNTLGVDHQHADYANAITVFNAMPFSTASTSANADPSSFPGFDSHSFLNPQQLMMLNSVYPNHMDQSCLVATMNNMGYSYGSDQLFNNTDVNPSSDQSPQASTSFSGLSCGYPASQGY